MKTSRLRCSLATLFFITTTCALACAAFVNANAWWWSGVFTVSFLSIIVSLCASLFAKGETRAFAVGVVLTSVMYAFHFYAPYLISDHLYREIYPAYVPVSLVDDAHRAYSTLIWHTIWGAPYSLFGGFVARFIYLRFWSEAPRSDGSRGNDSV